MGQIKWSSHRISLLLSMQSGLKNSTEGVPHVYAPPTWALSNQYSKQRSQLSVFCLPCEIPGITKLAWSVNVINPTMISVQCPLDHQFLRQIHIMSRSPHQPAEAEMKGVSNRSGAIVSVRSKRCHFRAGCNETPGFRMIKGTMWSRCSRTCLQLVRLKSENCVACKYANEIITTPSNPRLPACHLVFGAVMNKNVVVRNGLKNCELAFFFFTPCFISLMFQSLSLPRDLYLCPGETAYSWNVTNIQKKKYR